MLFQIPAISIPVTGETARFPVARIFCVGRNYAAHAREMGGDPTREPPFFFMKPASAATCERVLPFPSDTDDLHHEVELVIAIGADRKPFGYAVGVDLTKRDRQAELRKNGQPWDRAKSFPRSAPISAITRAADAPGAFSARIALSVNGALKQESTLAHLIWKAPEILERVDAIWELAPGDLIFTGTPEGVGPLKRGDKIDAVIDGVGALSFSFD